MEMAEKVLGEPLLLSFMDMAGLPGYLDFEL